MNHSSNSQPWGLTVLRVVVGAVFLMHGCQKLFVWGFHGVAGFLGPLGVPAPAAAAVVLTLKWDQRFESAFLQRRVRCELGPSVISAGLVSLYTS